MQAYGRDINSVKNLLIKILIVFIFHTDTDLGSEGEQRGKEEYAGIKEQ